MKFDNLPDNDLIMLLGEGNNKAFEEIYERYWLKLYSAAFKRLKNRELAQEIVQDFFTRFWIDRSAIKIHTSLQGYLFSSIRYLVLNHIRNEVVRSKYKETFQNHNEYFDNSTEEKICYNELIKSLESYINKLPVKCRSVFDLSRKEYKNNKEIAAQLGISEKTVENHLTKAIRFLRVNLNLLVIVISSSITVFQRS